MPFSTLVFHENRFVEVFFDVFVGGSELQVLLFHRLDPHLTPLTAFCSDTKVMDLSCAIF